MKKGRKPQQFIQQPIYEGGPKAMMAFIQQSLKYPKDAQKVKIEGTVQVRIRINYKGVVEKTKVISNLGYGCDEEAQRVAALLRFKMPKNRGIKAHFHKTLNFHFRLPKKQDSDLAPNDGVAQKQSLRYTVTQSATNNDATGDRIKKNGYHYKINI